MDKEQKLGRMVIFIKVNLETVMWNGHGTLSFPDGSVYVGEWANGFMNGEGTFTWSDGKATNWNMEKWKAARIMYKLKNIFIK